MPSKQRKQQERARQELKRQQIETRRRRVNLVWRTVGFSLLVGGVGGLIIQAVTRSPSAMEKVFADNKSGSIPGSGDGVWAYTYVGTDSTGQPVLAADGQLRWEDGECTNAGRVVVGEVLVNPGSASVDIENYLDTAETTIGVGRIDERRGVEKVQLPDGTDLGRMPVLWFQPEGGSLCSSLRSIFANIEDLNKPAGLDDLEKEILAQDADEGLVRYIGSWTRVPETILVASRPELVFDKDIDSNIVNLAVRILPQDGPNVVMARIEFIDMNHAGSTAKTDSEQQ